MTPTNTNDEEQEGNIAVDQQQQAVEDHSKSSDHGQIAPSLPAVDEPTTEAHVAPAEAVRLIALDPSKKVNFTLVSKTVRAKE